MYYEQVVLACILIHNWILGMDKCPILLLLHALINSYNLINDYNLINCFGHSILTISNGETPSPIQHFIKTRD